MTTFAYSASQNAFWFSDSQSVPDNAIEVSDDVFNEFSITPLDGKRRIVGSDGLPKWEVIPPPTIEELKAAAIAAAEQKKFRLLAEASEITQDWNTDLLLGIIIDDDKAKLIAWRGYIKALNAVDTSSVEINWPTPPAE
ncbi:TPA: tail fiber assembly protein [Yersinia enterocolitica]|nr:tail fiber assembly protein [Yersinia enterocolitica]